METPLRNNELKVIALLSGMIREYRLIDSKTPLDDMHKLICKTANEVLDVCEAKQSEQQSNCNLPRVSVSLLSDLPENMPLYKDSGLWQLRTDDMDDVVIQQHSNESDNEFLEKCHEIQREKEKNER